MPSTTFKLRNVGSLGIISDIPSYDLPPSAWSDAMNVRFEGNKISKFGGNLRLVERFVKDGERTIAISQMRDTRLDVHWILATDKNIYRKSSMTRHEIISEFEDGYNATLEQPWYYTTLSNCLVMNNVNDAPQGLIPKQEKIKTLPGWGKVTGLNGPVQEEWRAYTMASYKNFLIAMNTYEEGGEYPQRIRWSDIADINQLPFNWDSSSTESSAGFNDLTDATGEIVDGLAMRDSFVIYTTNDTFLMQYIGGNSIFRFTKLFTGSGLLARRCMTEFEGKHFVVSTNDVYVHDGSNRKSIVAGRIRDKLMDEITSVNPLSVRCFTNYPKHEIWITYCRPGTDLRNQGEWSPNKAAVWNWEYDTWTFYELPENTDINLVYPLSTDERSWKDYGLEPGEKPEDEGEILLKNSWDSQGDYDQWELTGQNFANQILVGMGKFGTIYQLDVGENFHNDDFTGAYNFPESGANVPIKPGVYEFTKKPVIAWFERTQIDFDELEVPTWGNIKVRKLYPQFRGYGGVFIELGGADNPDQLPNFKERQHFKIKEQYQVSFRVNNKYVAVKFVDDQEGEWAFTGYDMNIQTGGVR